MDASKLGAKFKVDKNQKTILSPEEETLITNTFLANEAKEDFSVLVDFAQIEAKNYSFAAGQYFELKMQHINLSEDEFKAQLNAYQNELNALFDKGEKLQKEILTQMKNLRFGE